MAGLSKTTNPVNHSNRGFLYSRTSQFFQDFSEPERGRSSNPADSCPRPQIDIPGGVAYNNTIRFDERPFHPIPKWSRHGIEFREAM